MTAGGFECPHCGFLVPRGRRACPECGSDDATGWQSSEEIDYQSLELPDRDARTAGAGSGWRLAAVRAIAVLAVMALVLWLVLVYGR